VRTALVGRPSRKELAKRIRRRRPRGMRQLMLETWDWLCSEASRHCSRCRLVAAANAIGLDILRAPAKFQMGRHRRVVYLTLSRRCDFWSDSSLAGISNLGISDAISWDSRTGTTGKNHANVAVLSRPDWSWHRLIVGRGCAGQLSPALAGRSRFNPNGVVSASVACALQIPQPEVAKARTAELPAAAHPGVLTRRATDAIPLGSNHDDRVSAEALSDEGRGV